MANEIRDAFNAVFADGPTGSPSQPVKSRIRQEVGAVIQQQVDAKASSADLAAAVDGEKSQRETADTALGSRIDSVENIAYTNAAMYESTAAGLAATMDGQQFQVDDGNFYVRYRNNAGVAVEVGRQPGAGFVGDLYYSAVGTGDATISYADPALASSAPASLVLTAASFSSGEPGLGIAATGTTLKFIDARALVPASLDRDYVIELDVEFTEKTDTVMTFGFGLAIGAEGSRKGIIHMASGSISAIDEATLTGLIVGPAYDQGALIKVFLLVRADSSVYWSTDISGVRTPYQLLVSSEAAGPVWIAVRRLSKSVVRLRTEVSDVFVRQGRDDALLVANTDIVRKPIALTGMIVGAKSPVKGQFSAAAPTKGVEVYSGTLATPAFGTSTVGAAELGIAPQLGIEYILRTIIGSVTGNPAIGIGFTDAAAAGQGLVYRANGQVFVTSSPSSVTVTNFPNSAAYAEGDVIEVSVTLLDATPGAGSALYRVARNGLWSDAMVATGIPDVSRLAVFARAVGTWFSLGLSTRPPKAVGSSVAGAPLYYVSPAGNDGAAGTEAAPFATVAKAFSLISRVGTIIVAGGEYREAINLGFSGHEVEIRSAPDARPIFLGSERLVVTKTPGYTQVYQAALAAKPVGIGGVRGAPVIFEWGTPSKPIPAGEEHDLHRGQTHRLSYTDMFEAADLGTLDTPAGLGKWWWDAGVIYFAATDGSDATLKRYEARVRQPFVVSGKGRLRTSRLDTMYSTYKGFQVTAGIHWHREDCRTFGNYHDGFGDNGNYIYAVRDEAGGCGNDGINGTVADPTGDNRTKVTSAIYIDPWSHDNADDGLSHHARGEGSIFGGLMEYNGGGGNEFVNGSQFAAYGTLCRHNTNGFLASGTATTDDRNKTVFRLISCISEDNSYNYLAADRGVILAEQSVSRRATVAGYRGDATGEVRAGNCRDTGSTAAKSGNVVVINDNMLDV